MKILAVECSAAPVSCALSEDGKTVGEFYLNTAATHSQTLMPMIDGMLKNAGVRVSDIDLFAVAAGPGSFTGVRIGIAAVKGLAFGGNKPCCAVSTLEGIAFRFASFDCTVCACMDARCGQIYNAVFEIRGGTVRRLCEDRAIAISVLVDEICDGKYDGGLILAGDGAAITKAAIDKAAEEREAAGDTDAADKLKSVRLAEENLRYQSANGVAFAALMMYNRKNTVKADELLPTYLRLPQAQRELNRRTAMSECSDRRADNDA